MATAISNKIVYSPFQEDIFKFIKESNGSAVVIAVAGSGKTTTIVEAANRLNPKLQAKFVAFSKRIQLSLADKLPTPDMAQTLHSLGYKGWNSYDVLRGNVPIDTQKMRKILKDVIPYQMQRDYLYGVLKLVSLAKQVGLVPGKYKAPAGIAEDTAENWLELMDFYSVDFPRNARRERAIEFGQRALFQSLRLSEKSVDFDDMIYLPVIHNAKLPQNDVLFVDEAQDINLVQRRMLHMATKQGGRVIAVGDPHQAIFGFRGADTQSIQRIKEEFDAIELPLTVCYRCPLKIIERARQYVSHMTPSAGAKPGVLEELDQEWTPETFRPDDVILCRNTAPLIDLAYTLIRRGVGANVLGKDVASGLVSLVRSLRARSMTELRSYLQSYQDNEVRRLMDENKEWKVGAILDRCDTVRIFIDNATSSASVDNVIFDIEKMFIEDGDKKQIVTLSTIHKAKGLEWPRVFILNWHLMPSQWARQDWEFDQERNLQYVAVTRAMEELYFINTR